MRFFHNKALGFACALVLTACAGPPDRVEITETIERSEHSKVPRVTATSAERFARVLPQTAPPMQAASGQQSGSDASPFAYETPEGWTEVAPTQFRNPNFVAGASGEIECYVSVLAGGGGGNAPNMGKNFCSPIGSTWFFQYWHRMPAGAPSSFSNALQALIQ